MTEWRGLGVTKGGGFAMIEGEGLHRLSLFVKWKDRKHHGTDTLKFEIASARGASQ